MRVHRLSAATAAALLVVLAGKILAGALSVLTLSAVTCVRPPSLLAPVGLHLDLLAGSGVCPDHTYLAGRHLHSAAHLLATVAAFTLVAGVVGFLMTLGAGWWARRALRAARGWIATWPAPAQGHPAPTAVPLLVTASSTPAPGPLGLHRPIPRRGPPVGLR